MVIGATVPFWPTMVEPQDLTEAPFPSDLEPMRSAVRSLVCTLLVGLLVLAAGCETPTTDPDQVLRDLLVGKTWTPDPAYEATEPNGTTLYFWAAGTGVEGGSHPFTWTILKGTLTMVSAQKGTDVTPNVSLDAHHLIVTYVGKTLHLVS